MTTRTATKPKSKTSPKKVQIPAGAKVPQDHKAPQDQLTEDDIPKLSETRGREFLKPVEEVDYLDQIDLALESEALHDPGLTTAERKATFRSLIAHVVDNYVVDKAGFKKFSTGAGAGARVSNLVFAYLAAMGEDDAS